MVLCKYSEAPRSKVGKVALIAIAAVVALEALILIGSVIGCSGSKDVGKDSTWKEAGTYKVGVDIPEGEYYVVQSGQGMAIVKVLADPEAKEPIGFALFETFGYVTVHKGESLVISSGKFISVDGAEPSEVTFPAGPGMYKIGRDIPAGEYIIKADDGDDAYFSIERKSRLDSSSIMSNGFFTGAKNIKVEDGQYLTIDRGQIFSK